MNNQRRKELERAIIDLESARETIECICDEESRDYEELSEDETESEEMQDLDQIITDLYDMEARISNIKKELLEIIMEEQCQKTNLKT